MQILFLTDENINILDIEKILEYNKALTQNILLVNYNSLYEKNKFIYAKECLVVNGNNLLLDVLLSPSIVVDLGHSFNYERLELYLGTCWENTHQAFYGVQNYNNFDLNIKEKTSKTKKSHCICGIDNNERPIFHIMEDSISIQSHENILTSFNTIGLVEQAITEYFADENFFTQLSLNKKISNHQSILFYVEFNIVQMYGDFTVEDITFTILNFNQLLSYNQNFIFNYFDNLLKYRLDTYIEKVKFRTHIIKLCDEYEIDLEPSYFKTFILRKGDYIGLQRTYYSALNSKKGISIINDKHKTNQFLRENGFNANLSYEYTLDDLVDKEVIKKIPLQYPITLKPTDKKEGYGVVTNILNEKRMLISVKKMLNLEDIKPVLLEEFFEGVTYRVLVIGGEVVAVLKNIPVSILGDGESSVEELIKAKNIISKSRVRINNALRLSIFNDGKRWETVLAKGEKYIISHNSHASNGGQAVNVTDVFGDMYKKVASDACKSLDLKIAGIDMIVNSKGEYRIIEINCGPALATHVNPKHGTSIKTYTKVLYSLLQEMDIDKKENSYLKELVPYHE